MAKTTCLIGIIVTIPIGTYLYMTCCSRCGMAMAGNKPISPMPISIGTVFLKAG